ncbi:MAG: HEAT repeat domain-containing protein, partial [Bacteroidota bacterium]
SGERIINALINTLNTDPNPNVRIAAIDALERFSGQDQVRTLIARSLNNQSSPTVQLATIDILVKYQIKAGAPFLEKLLDQSGLNPSVRVQAQLALEILS